MLNNFLKPVLRIKLRYFENLCQYQYFGRSKNGWGGVGSNPLDYFNPSLLLTVLCKDNARSAVLHLEDDTIVR